MINMAMVATKNRFTCAENMKTACTLAPTLINRIIKLKLVYYKRQRDGLSYPSSAWGHRFSIKRSEPMCAVHSVLFTLPLMTQIY